MAQTTWRKDLLEALKGNNETWNDIEANTLSDLQLDTPFDNGYGGSAGDAFTVWTKNRVYFPVVYDGAEWIESVSRNPDGAPTNHVGGQ